MLGILCRLPRYKVMDATWWYGEHSHLHFGASQAGLAKHMVIIIVMAVNMPPRSDNVNRAFPGWSSDAQLQLRCSGPNSVLFPNLLHNSQDEVLRLRGEAQWLGECVRNGFPDSQSLKSKSHFIRHKVMQTMWAVCLWNLWNLALSRGMNILEKRDI